MPLCIVPLERDGFMKWVFFSALILCTQLFSDDSLTINVDGSDRTYIIHVPKEVVEKNDISLVLYLHGAGANAEIASKYYGWEEKADQESFIVVFPQALPVDQAKPSDFKQNPNVWNDGSERANKNVNDVAYLRRVIEDVSSRHSIDPTRIYMSGFSNGASMTFRAGVELSNMLAAIAPVMGQLYLQSPHPENPVSLIYIVGTVDPLNPFNGGMATNPWDNKPVYSKPMGESLNVWLSLLNLDPNKGKKVSSNEVISTSYGPNETHQQALYVVLENQGHQWPGSNRNLPVDFAGPNNANYNATDQIWKFFRIKALTYIQPVL
jgi:polyhydroxybutyrate depolymerase